MFGLSYQLIKMKDHIDSFDLLNKLHSDQFVSITTTTTYEPEEEYELIPVVCVKCGSSEIDENNICGHCKTKYRKVRKKNVKDCK